MSESGHERTVLGDITLGAVAGCVATTPMTIAMEIMHRQFPDRERDPLPPRQITMQVAEAVGGKEHLDEEERVGLTLLAHFGLGTAAGALYGLLARRRPLPDRSPARASAWGSGLVTTWACCLPWASCARQRSTHSGGPL
jgi:hypothetical protein